MGQDGIYLQVMAGDPSEPQQKNAKRVYDLLKKGKHWVLVTLLLANVIVNETLPVVLDRCLGGGVAAVVGSTFLIGTCHPISRMQSYSNLTSRVQSYSARSSHNPFAFATVFRLVDTCPNQCSP